MDRFYGGTVSVAVSAAWYKKWFFGFGLGMIVPGVALVTHVLDPWLSVVQAAWLIVLFALISVAAAVLLTILLIGRVFGAGR